MVCSAVDGQILRFGVPRPGPCHGPQEGACLCGRVSASAALVSRGARRAFHEPSVAGSGLPTAPGPFRERQAVCRTFETGIPSPVRIALGSLKGPGRASAFPALQLDRCPARRGGKVFNFGLALGATGRLALGATGPRAGIFPVARGGLARLSHPGLASADRLVADLLPAGGFRDSGLAGRRAQHDPGHAIRGPNLGGQTDVRPRLTRSKDHAGRTPAAVP